MLIHSFSPYILYKICSKLFFKLINEDKVELLIQDVGNGIEYLKESFILYSQNFYPSDNSDSLHPTFAEVTQKMAFITGADFRFRVRIREIL